MTATELVQASRLRLGRDLKNLSQSELASLVDVTPAAISQFESGDSSPSDKTLHRMAEALSMPVDFFSLPMRETHEGFFRSLRKSSVAQRRRARALAHLVHDLGVQPGAAGLLHDLSLPREPLDTLDENDPAVAQAARAVRAAWRVGPGPIANVVEVLERHGVLVLRLPLDAAEVDAFSLPFPDRPVVVLGADKGDRARSRFDAAHELGHLVMHGEAVWGVTEVEKQAHKFAAEFLMPTEDIAGELPARADWTTLFALKQRWQVSIAALLMRAKDLGVMPPAAYTTAMKGMSARGWRRAEPIPLGLPEVPIRTTELMKRGRANATWFPEALLPALSGAYGE